MDFIDLSVIIAMLYRIKNIDFREYNVVFYDIKTLKTVVQKWVNIPACFNCKVNAFDIDFDTKLIYIKSEVVNDE